MNFEGLPKMIGLANIIQALIQPGKTDKTKFSHPLHGCRYVCTGITSRLGGGVFVMPNTNVKYRLGGNWEATTKYSDGRTRPRKTFEQRLCDFWAKVKKTETCWVWSGSKNPQGYGMFCWMGESRSAHRLSFMFSTGQDPHPLLVLHRCDNPSCVNPEHLFLGDHQDNTNDARAKGRLVYLKGERCHASKMKVGQVLEARKFFNEGRTLSSLAKQFGITAQSMSKIVFLRSWRHV